MTNASIGWVIFAVFLLSEGFALGGLATGDRLTFYAGTMLVCVTGIATHLNAWADV